MTAIDSHDGHDGHDHPPFLAHHWETPEQQFEAGKLGMWLFLATEFLLFGGLFCAYAVYRHLHPEIFAYGANFLDTKWGAINTVVLILSSLTMALAVSAAQLGKTRALLILLGLSFLGGLGFMCIKYVEYSHKFHENIVWGTGFYEPAHHGDAHGDAAHAAAGHDDGALPHDGHVAEHEGLHEEFDEAVAHDKEVLSAHADNDEVVVVDDVVLPDAIAAVVEGLELPRSAVPDAAQGAPGLAASVLDAEHVEGDGHGSGGHGHGPAVPHQVDPNRPANAHIFFGIYFCMTGLHGIHVIIGMGVIAWLMYKAARGHFSPAYFTPVDLGGLYWHVVDLIWIFLFPLLYLIH